MRNRLLLCHSTYPTRWFPVCSAPGFSFEAEWANRELEWLGRRHRKGAPDTFDAAGYVALVRRLRQAEDEIVYAPAFLRELEEPIAGAIPIPRTVPLIITEGNYLLLDKYPWDRVRELLVEALVAVGEPLVIEAQ